MTTATATRLFDNIIELPSLTQEGGKSNEWFTPRKYVEAAREVMGGIDLDPASCAMANETVKAARYYTQEDDGLSKEWYGRVWLNPPYGRVNPELKGSTQSIQVYFMHKLNREYQASHIQQAVALIFGTSAYMPWFTDLWQYPVCFIKEHINFIRPDGTEARNGFGNLVVYLGSNEAKFIEVFSQFGTIAKRVSPPVVKPVNLSLWEEV